MPPIHHLSPIWHCFLNFTSHCNYWTMRSFKGKMSLYFSYLLHNTGLEPTNERWFEFFTGRFDLIMRLKLVIFQTFFSYDPGN